MNTKRRMLALGFSSVITLLLLVVFIVMSIHYQILALTILWSILFGVTLFATIIILIKAFNEK
jgi:flagellin-like protein